MKNPKINSLASMQTLIHELQTHQIELEIQNEELYRIKGELEKTRNRYEDLYDFSPVGYFTINEKGEVQEANLTGAKLFGIERRKLIGIPFTQFILKNDQDLFYKYRRLVLQTKIPQSCELRIVKTDGHHFHAHMVCILEKECKEEKKQFRISVFDINEQKRIEKTLWENKKRLLKAQQVSKMGFIDWNLTTNEIFLSQEVYRLYKIDQGQPLTTPELVSRMVHPDDMKHVQKSLDMAVKGEKPYDIEHRIVRTDGEIIWVHAQGELERDQNGNPINLLGTVIDITEYKKLETSLRKLTKNLEEKVNQRTIDLEESNTALRILLKQREKDKIELEEKIVSNIKELVIPHLESLMKFRLKDHQKELVHIIESNLQDITSPLMHNLSSDFIKLTPMEIRVASFVRQGKTSKEIANSLNMSKSTIDTHRYSIRKKLSIHNKKINLRTHLRTLSL